MSSVDAAIVFLPRFTTLIGASSFKTQPLDVSQFGSAQFQVWRGPLRGTDPTFLIYLEESLDGNNWVLGPSTPQGYDPGTDDPTLQRPKLFSYAFRLRWFRVRVELGGTDPVATCWAEGLLRNAGGGGAWRATPGQASSGTGLMAAARLAYGQRQRGAGRGIDLGSVAPSSGAVQQAVGGSPAASPQLGGGGGSPFDQVKSLK